MTKNKSKAFSNDMSLYLHAKTTQGAQNREGKLLKIVKGKENEVNTDQDEKERNSKRANEGHARQKQIALRLYSICSKLVLFTHFNCF